MKILFITQWFDPEPTFKGLAFAKALVGRGHDVQVLTGFPNYPGGRLYDGYRIRLFRREEMDGIQVLRVPLYPSHSRSARGRVANYLSFALAAALIGPWVTRSADVAYVYHPPATAIIPALVLRAFRGVPFVLDVQDLWPDTLRATGMVHSATMLRLLGAFCRFAYRCATHIAVLSPGFKQRLIERGVPADKVSVVRNWCSEEEFALSGTGPSELAEPGMAERFKVVFAGTMGAAQALDAVLDAAALAVTRVPRAQFVFVGGGIDADRLRNRAEALHLPNVRFLPRMPYAEIGRVLSLADVLLVHLRDDPLFRITIPSKIQAYMFMARPVLAAVRGDAADLVTEAGAGVVCDPESPEAIVRAVEDLYSRQPGELRAIGERGRAYYQQALSLAAGCAHFEAIFARAAGAHEETVPCA